MGLSVLDTDRRVWQRPCVKHKQARAWPELKEAPRAARGQEVKPPTKKKLRPLFRDFCQFTAMDDESASRQGRDIRTMFGKASSDPIRPVPSKKPSKRMREQQPSPSGMTYSLYCDNG